MDINSIKDGISKMKQTIETVESLIDDYNSCKSAISKKMIEAAIVKYSAPFADTTAE